MKNIIMCICCALFFVRIAAQTESQRKKIISNYDMVKSDALIQNLEKKNIERVSRINKFLSILSEEKRLELDRANLRDITPEGIPLFYTTHNNTMAVTIRTDELYVGGSLDLDLTGDTMVAGVWEAFQSGGSYALATHEDLVGRITTIDFGAMGASNHGTQVAGTIISSGSNTANNAGRGIAYEASLLVANVENDNTEMAEQAANGLLVSNHSYGFTAGSLPVWRFGAYDGEASVLDTTLETYPYYVPVISAGNDRNDPVDYSGKNGYDLLTGMSMAKNGITSAAVLPVDPYVFFGSVTMSSFSNYGPTDDGRIKPDISSQGVNVFATTSNPNNTGYAFTAGTSFSAPAISGLLLLLQEHYSNVNSKFMLAATAKGILLHTADEAGNGLGPDYRFGWGLANGGKAAQAITNSGTSSFVEETVLENTNSRIFDIIALGNEPLMVSISWTDPAASPVNGIEDDRTPVLVNDLDLLVTKGGTEYFPWKLNPTNPAGSATRNSTNDVDNFEKVEVASPSVDEVFEVTINHKGVIEDGAQNYSLVITGGTLVTLSTQDNALSNSLKLFPNPSKGELTISFNTGNKSANDVNVAILDLSGRQVFNANFEGASQIFKETIDLKNIQSGVYIANISQGNSSTSQKIIIE